MTGAPQNKMMGTVPASDWVPRVITDTWQDPYAGYLKSEGQTKTNYVRSPIPVIDGDGEQFFNVYSSQTGWKSVPQSEWVPVPSKAVSKDTGTGWLASDTGRTNLLQRGKVVTGEDGSAAYEIWGTEYVWQPGKGLVPEYALGQLDPLELPGYAQQLPTPRQVLQQGNAGWQPWSASWGQRPLWAAVAVALEVLVAAMVVALALGAAAQVLARVLAG